MKIVGLRSLLPALLFFLIALAISIWIWTSSGNQATLIHQKKESLELTRATAQSRLMQSGAEKNLVLAHLAEYEQLEKRGVTDGGKRLAWLEAVQKANESSRLYGLQYTLAPAGAKPSSAEMEQTSMKLRMPLLTENDLLLFLNNLASGETGLFQTKSCTLSRTGNIEPQMLNQPGLQAECELLWYSAKKPETPS